LLKFGVLKNNITICDSKGVVYKGRENINSYKEVFAKDTKDRTLSDAVKNSDIFLGMSSAGVLSKEMVKTMAENPIIFALANPNPEILPEEAKLARNDVIVATGRSDYPNQVNNVLCFPYLFRVALDMRAKMITDEMQINAVRALSELAREEVIDDDLKKAYPNREFNFGREYFLPLPFDKRLLEQFRKFIK